MISDRITIARVFPPALMISALFCTYQIPPITRANGLVQPATLNIMSHFVGLRMSVRTGSAAFGRRSSGVIGLLSLKTELQMGHFIAATGIVSAHIGQI